MPKIAKMGLVAGLKAKKGDVPQSKVSSAKQIKHVGIGTVGVGKGGLRCHFQEEGMTCGDFKKAKFGSRNGVAR